MFNKGLPPIATPATRIFILGSLPGRKSLAEQRYYAHSNNQFWILVGLAIGVDLAALDYDARLQALAAHRIGLWDVVEAARREGSADETIRDARLNDVGGLKAAFSDLRAIAFNGGRAAEDGFRLLAGVSDLELFALPSSSARAAMPISVKARAWSIIGRFTIHP